MRNIVQILLLGLFGAVACLSSSHIALGQSDFQRLVLRVQEIRQTGSPTNGIHLLSARVQINEDDYFLMGCDISSARRNHPEVKNYESLAGGKWFAGSPDLNSQHAPNGSFTEVGGKWRVDAFYTSLTRPEYQASPQEVAWHYLRVKELRAQNIPVSHRVAIMNGEAKSKPWERMQ